MVYMWTLTYIVYITDVYTGNIIVKENVTDTHFTSSAQVDDLCLVCQVSAWNAGRWIEPVQDSTPQGKQAKDILN